MSEQVVWYVPYVVDGRIKVSSYTRWFYKGSERALAKHKKLPQTKEQAIAAITPFLEEANAKAAFVSARVRELEEEQACSIELRMKGDTYGIYDEGVFISFMLGGYHFSYTLEGS